ncbi:MAG: chorismate lyase [Chromatiaceae bacterium]|nr:chorismate lyase [Gammaproteobacteria bacterium]MCP5300148.1 chorismate lyase [Chromatiaceae bacterium]MCP5422220.1 chorismate lyase [Chromatiaceae bacterium]
MFTRPRSHPPASREPRWTRLSPRRMPGCDPATHAWLVDRGSLTRSVIASCAGRFSVELVSQGHGSALASETALLAGGPAQATLVREVRLRCDREAWVFARTLIPLPSVRGPARALTRLGRRPLGEVLFSNPTTRRLCVEVARITPRHRLFARATGHLKRPPVAIWGRRTLFAYGGSRILVNELFLPVIAELHR